MFGKFGKPRPRGIKKKRYREQTKCRFCRDKERLIDYKDVGTLQKLTTQQGKLFSPEAQRQLRRLPARRPPGHQAGPVHGADALHGLTVKSS